MSLSKIKAKERKFRTCYQVVQKEEEVPNTDMVDRSGYIPVSLQYARMMAAGADKEKVIGYKYDYDYAELVNALKEGTVDVDKVFGNVMAYNKLEKTELVDILKDKVKDYSKAKQEYDKQMEQYYRHEQEKQIRQDAINAYKESLKNTPTDLS